MTQPDRSDTAYLALVLAATVRMQTWVRSATVDGSVVTVTTEEVDPSDPELQRMVRAEYSVTVTRSE